MTTVATERDVIPPRAQRTPPRPIPLRRVVSVELRKMFDTRSGFWLMASIAIAAVLATAAVIIFAPDSELTYNTFAAAIGFPMAVILPMIAVLSVTGEWSQRTGLSTFTFLPHRGRVIGAKAICSIAVGVVSMLLAFGIGAIGNVVGPALAGVDPTWDIHMTDFLNVILANVLGLMVGFMLGVLIRNSAGAIVAYFVYSFLLPTMAALLAGLQEWFRDLQPWVDFNYASTALFNGSLTSEQWSQLGVTTVGWLVIPTAIGVWLVMRSEVK
jgi:ABC-2 type transport system permease protein